MRFLRDKWLGADLRRAGWYGALGLFALALFLQSTLTWIEAGHTAANHGAACSFPVAGIPTDAGCRPDSGLPTREAPHDSRSCLQCQFFRNAAGAEAVTVADTDVSAAILPEGVPAPVCRAVEAPRHLRPEPRAPPLLPAFPHTAFA